LRRGDPLHAFVLETFATTGASPSLEEIRVRFSLGTVDDAEERVRALENTGAIHRNPGDASITHAYPFSNDRTAHRVHLADGLTVFAMCAIDALGMPFMLHRAARIQSACTECSTEIRIAIQAKEIVDHAPEETVVWLAARGEECVAATDLCPTLNFFCSPDHLGAWKDRSGAKGEQLTLSQALGHGRQVFEHLMDDTEEQRD
jgi:hypothetical protein